MKICLLIETGGTVLLSDYHDDLTDKQCDAFDIVSVSQEDCVTTSISKFVRGYIDWTWERPKVKYYLRLREKYRDIFGIPYNEAYFNIEKPTGELFFEECSSIEGFIVKFTEEEADKYIKEFNNILEKVEIE